MSKASKTQKRSVYMLKRGTTLKEAYGVSDEQKEYTLSIPGTDEAILVIANSKPRRPVWVEMMFDQDDAEMITALDKIRTTSSAALLLLRSGDISFAIPLGYGHGLLDDSIINEGFGFKVVLNCIKQGSIKSVDKASLEHRHQHREQTPQAGDFDEFAIDFDRDLVQAIAGIPQDQKFGKTVAGLDSVQIKLPVESKNLWAPLNELVAIGESDEYLTRYPGIDKVRFVRNEALVDELNVELVKKLIAKDIAEVWLAPPEISDYGRPSNFRFEGISDRLLRSDIYIKDFLGLVPKLNELTVKKLYSWRVTELDESEEIAGSWPVFKCLHAELKINDDIYVLNAGKWYRVKLDFVEEVEAYVNPYLSNASTTIALIPFNHADEKSYNAALCQGNSNLYLLDRDLVRPRGAKSSLEVCDVFSKDKIFIHIKRYSSSATLSHLFNQGLNSAELFKDNPAFREQVKAKLPISHQCFDPIELRNEDKWTVCFAIIAKDISPLNLPFFSKISLRRAILNLKRMNFEVIVSAIHDQSVDKSNLQRTGKLSSGVAWPQPTH